MLEKLFKLKENNTNVRTEVVGGITTFMTMAYILAVNPQILSATGMDSQAILIATALASFIGTFGSSIAVGYLKTFIIYTVVAIAYYFLMYTIFLTSPILIIRKDINNESIFIYQILAEVIFSN